MKGTIHSSKRKLQRPLRSAEQSIKNKGVFMKLTSQWRPAAAAVVIALPTACGWMSTGPSAFRLASSSPSIRTVGGGLASCSSAWTSRAPSAAKRRSESRSYGGGGGNGVRMQVWSNPQAVQDYKDLLNGDAPDEKFDGPSVIIGRGRLGTALATMGMGEDVVLGRGEPIPDTLPASSGRGEAEADGGVLTEFPIYVCVPEGEVAAVIDSCPPEKREDLVFMQNGCLEPLLKSRGLCRGEQTQATLYFNIKKV